MGRGSSGIGDASAVLGRNSAVPSQEEITSGNASYAGIPLRYDPGMHAEASNYTTEIWVSNKFFQQSPEGQRHILNHEVAHNWSDEMMAEHTGDWQRFTSAFVQEKKVPESSSAYARGQRTYFEGLYGDIGATAVSETTTRAITEYLDNPERLRQRSEQAYRVVDRFVRRRLRRG